MTTGTDWYEGPSAGRAFRIENQRRCLEETDLIDFPSLRRHALLLHDEFIDPP